jgi:hypothetical protein
MRHSVSRARERYGIDLDAGDAARRCQAGEGLTHHMANGRSLHALVVGDRVVWLIYLPPEAGSRDRYGTVMTTVPPNAAQKRVVHDVQNHARRIKRRR